MGYIRLLSSDSEKTKVLIDNTFTYLILRTKGEIKLLEVENLIDFLQEKGKAVSESELNEIMRKAKEERDQWLEWYRKNLKKLKKGGKYDYGQKNSIKVS
mgnify:CR=1 FL=1